MKPAQTPSDATAAVERQLEVLWSAPPVHRDPVLRLGAFLLVMIFVSLLPASLLLTAVALLLAGWALRQRGRDAIRTVVFVFSLTLLLNAFTEPGEAIVSVGPFVMTRQGVRVGLAHGTRLVALASLMLAAVPALDLLAIADRTAELLARVAPRRAQSGTLSSASMTLALAVRFIPVVLAEARRLELAQRARPGGARSLSAARRLAARRLGGWRLGGWRLGGWRLGGWRLGGPRLGGPRLGGRALALAPLFLPLVGGTVRRATEVAITLDVRGFASGVCSSRLLPPAVGAFAAAAAALLAVGVLLVWVALR